MILLYGRLDDPPLVATLEALQAQRAQYALLSQATLHREHLHLRIANDGVDGALTVAGQSIPLASIRAIYARPLELTTRGIDANAIAQARGLHDHLYEWLDVTQALVVNPPAAMQSNASKPLQAQLVGELGFRVPDTLVTSDGDEVLAFLRTHERVIYKSISGVRSIVRELNAAAIGRLRLLSALPVQFQAYVPGTDVRVHVVGGRAFACTIESAATDYRYAARDHVEATIAATELPGEVAARCVALAAHLRLPLAGIDLRRRPDGEYVCFEVNPMPAYSFFEHHAGQPISTAIARMLVKADRNDTEVRDGAGHRKSHDDRRHDHAAARASVARGLRQRHDVA